MARSTRPSRTALSEGMACLARRPLTVLELEIRLRDKGYPDEEIEEACRVLRRDRLLDDRRLAAHYMAVRMERKGHGPLRLSRDLERRGVDPALVAAVLQEGIENEDLEPDRILAREIRKRAPAGNLSPGAYRRLYNALLRAGFESFAIRRELDTIARNPDAPEDPIPPEP